MSENVEASTSRSPQSLNSLYKENFTSDNFAFSSSSKTFILFTAQRQSVFIQSYYAVCNFEVNL
jgi:hypothetical protein